MTETRDKTCEERIDAELASTIESLTELDQRRVAAEEADDTDAQDAALTELDEYALCIDLSVTMKVQLSWGGPSDQFEIEVIRGQHGWELADNHATYRFLDWFDGATRRTDDPVVMAYLEQMVERISPEWAGE